MLSLSLSAVLQSTRAVVDDLKDWTLTHTRPHESTTLHIHAPAAPNVCMSPACFDFRCDEHRKAAYDAARAAQTKFELVEDDAGRELNELIASETWASDDIDVALHSETLVSRIFEDCAKSQALHHVHWNIPWTVLAAFKQAASCARYNNAHALLRAISRSISRSGDCGVSHDALSLAVRCAMFNTAQPCTDIAMDAISLWNHVSNPGDLWKLELCDLLHKHRVFTMGVAHLRAHTHIFALIEMVAAVDALYPRQLVDFLLDSRIRNNVIDTLMAGGPRTLYLLAHVVIYCCVYDTRHIDVVTFLWTRANPRLKAIICNHPQTRVLKHVHRLPACIVNEMALYTPSRAGLDSKEPEPEPEPEPEHEAKRKRETL